MTNFDAFALGKKPTVFATGLVALDVVIGADTARPERLYAGGTCGNVVCILSYLGWDSFPVARLQADDHGKEVLRDLRRWSVHLDFASTAPLARTAVVVQRIHREESGKVSHRFAWTCPHCGSWLPGYAPVHAKSVQEIIDRLNNPAVFFFDRVSRGSLLLARACAELGSLVVFEPSGIGNRQLFREALQHAHILKYSNERMGELSGLGSTKHPLLQIETSGAEGLRYKCNLPHFRTSGWQNCEALRGEAVADTAGAGDWCTAGIIHLLGRKGLAGMAAMEQGDIERAISFGQALAAWNCAYEGARGGMYAVGRSSFEAAINHILFGHEMRKRAAKRTKTVKQNSFRCNAPGCKAGKAMGRAKAEVP